MLAINDESGFKSVINNTPRIREITKEGNKNCQTETPAALVTTNSFVLLSLAKVKILPKSATKGSSFWIIIGNLSIAIKITVVKFISSPDARLKSSTKSIKKTKPNRIDDDNSKP